MTRDDTTQQLTEKAKAGDGRAFDQLVEQFGERLEASVRARLGEGGLEALETEEILQETFVRAFQSIERFEWQEEDSFYRWLSGIAKRVILVAARQYRGKRRTELAREIPAIGTSPSKALRREERLQRLEEAIKCLSGDHREVILLARIDGLTINEIAERMDRSPAAVKQLLSRALRKLREAFGETESLHLPHRKLEVEGGENAD
ncbi:MAG: sigma-70 family RNA polymerase sigma factor [Armatimonadetes bacterium]|nr:sigma-70 family RNA polymerase sigma factor [Armatimonadota bacterium]